MGVRDEVEIIIDDDSFRAALRAVPQPLRPFVSQLFDVLDDKHTNASLTAPPLLTGAIVVPVGQVIRRSNKRPVAHLHLVIKPTRRRRKKHGPI